MALGESDTRAKLIDPAIHARGWTEDLVKRIEFTEDSREAQDDAAISADNLRYFGAAVYEYDMAQGIEDGYLAACEIQKGRVNLDDTGITIEDILARNPVDANTGQPISAAELKARYEKTEYEDRILLPDRVMAMCQDLFKYLLDTGGPEQKTIWCRASRSTSPMPGATS